MRPTKESQRPCPNCATPIPRQNWRHYIKRCKGCFEHICTSCEFDSRCHDCYMNVSQDIVRAQYFAEKYGSVSSQPTSRPRVMPS